MTDSNVLERRYRRLLAVYPRGFRDEREQEILAVLLAGAVDGQRWPRPAEVADLLRRAIAMRLRERWLCSMAWEARHTRVMMPVRALVGLWLVILTTLLCVHGEWWGPALLPFAALHFYLANRLAQTTLRPPPPDEEQR